MPGSRSRRYANPETPVDNDDLELLAESLSGLGFYIEAVEQQRPDRDRLIAPLLARRLGEAPAPRPTTSRIGRDAVAELRAQLPRLVAEVQSAPRRRRGARGTASSKLATLRDDAELIGDATLVAQADAALKELDAGGAAALAAAVDAIADTRRRRRRRSPQETQRLLATDATAARCRAARDLSDRSRRSARHGRRAVARRSQRNPGDREALRTVRRGFHTLKGSGRMVGLTELGELAWEVEKVHNRLLEEDAPVTPAVLAMIGVAEPSFREWVDALQRRGRVTPIRARCTPRSQRSSASCRRRRRRRRRRCRRLADAADRAERAADADRCRARDVAPDGAADGAAPSPRHRAARAADRPPSRR